MATSGPGSVGHETLDTGTGAPRGRAARVLRAVLLLGTGFLVGWAALSSTHGWPGSAAQHQRLRLTVGSFEQNVTDPFGPEFRVSVTNHGPTPVDVVDVAPQGWQSTTPDVTVAPGGSVALAVDVTIRCRTTPPPSDVVALRVRVGASVRRVDLRLPEVPIALENEYWRRCYVPDMSDPRLGDLVGTWVVEQGGPGFVGSMLIRWDRDGRFRMDLGTHLDDRPGAYGRFALERHGHLLMRTSGGGDCRPGDRALWRVGVLADGRLYVKHLTAFDGFCSIEPGDVWIVKRVS